MLRNVKNHLQGAQHRMKQQGCCDLEFDVGGGVGGRGSHVPKTPALHSDFCRNLSQPQAVV
jgi:hypothetical protein